MGRKRRKPKPKTRSLDSDSNGQRKMRNLYLTQPAARRYAAQMRAEDARARRLNGPVTVRRIDEPP